jgi:hypothetical protein
MEHYDFLVIVGLLVYIAYAVYDLGKEVKEIRKSLDSK